MKLLTRALLLTSFSILTLGMILPRAYGQPYPYPLENINQFSPEVKLAPMKRIEKEKPQFVMVGDSVLHDGVDEKLLTQRLGVPALNFGEPGTGSAVWYLIIKNNIEDAPTPPKYIVIFFRDTVLTTPSFRTTGRYFSIVDDYAGKREPLVTEFAYLNAMTPLEKFAASYLPLYTHRWELRAALDNALRYPPATLMGCNRRCADRAIYTLGPKELDAVALQQAVFDVEALNAPENLNFQRNLKKSFLPAIVEIAKERNIHLIFARTKSTRFSHPNSEPPALQAYLADLQAYLAAENATYMDFAHEDRLLDSYFIDLLHFNSEGRAVFTEILAEKFAPFVVK
ncbi:MAG: hypothetical protein Fur002_09470 [Anaerolineales bacterium]